MTNNDPRITVARLSSEEFEEFLSWKARQGEAVNGEAPEPTENPEDLKLGDPISLGGRFAAGEGATLTEALSEALKEAFGEEMFAKIAESPEFAELQGLEDQIELASLKERVEAAEEEVGTLQMVLANVFLTTTMAKLSLGKGDTDTAERHIDSAAQLLLLTRLGKAHFHIHE